MLGCVDGGGAVSLGRRDIGGARGRHGHSERQYCLCRKPVDLVRGELGIHWPECCISVCWREGELLVGRVGSLIAACATTDPSKVHR